MIKREHDFRNYAPPQNTIKKGGLERCNEPNSKGNEKRKIQKRVKASQDRKKNLQNELNGSVDGFSINDSGIDRCGKDFVLSDGHDILRENGEIGKFARLKGS